MCRIARRVPELIAYDGLLVHNFQGLPRFWPMSVPVTHLVTVCNLSSVYS